MENIRRRFQVVLQLLYEISSPLPIPRYRTHSLLLCRLSCGRGPDSTDSQVLPGSHAEPAAIPWSPLPTGDQSSHPILKRVIAGISRAHLTRGFAPVTVLILAQIHNTLSQRPGPESTLVWAIAARTFLGFFRLGELLV